MVVDAILTDIERTFVGSDAAQIINTMTSGHPAGKAEDFDILLGNMYFYRGDGQLANIPASAFTFEFDRTTYVTDTNIF